MTGSQLLYLAATEFSVAEVHEAIAATRPDVDRLVFRDLRLMWADVTERTRRLANYLIDASLGTRTERLQLAGHESGQDHLAVYLHNGNEYLESMLGAFKARVAPFNVNYRYVAEARRVFAATPGWPQTLLRPLLGRKHSIGVGANSLHRVSKRAWDSETLPQGDDKVTAVRQMFDAIAPRYDLVNRIMTFRLDVHWRRKAVKLLVLPIASTVIDLASGTGDLCVDLVRASHRPLSFDLSFGMLAADRSGAPRAQADILRLPLPDHSVDGATCGFALRNLVELPKFFDELGRVVRPGGRIALLDVGVPRNRLIRWGNNIYFGKIVPKIGSLLSDGAAYRYLPKSVAYLPAREQMLTDLRAAGFADAEHHQLSGGITQLLLGTRS